MNTIYLDVIVKARVFNPMPGTYQLTPELLLDIKKRGLVNLLAYGREKTDKNLIDCIVDILLIKINCLTVELMKDTFLYKVTLKYGYSSKLTHIEFYTNNVSELNGCTHFTKIDPSVFYRCDPQPDPDELPKIMRFFIQNILVNEKEFHQIMDTQLHKLQLQNTLQKKIYNWITLCFYNLFIYFRF
jgi:hypothetical protein